MRKIFLALLILLTGVIITSCEQIIDPPQEQQSINLVWKGEFNSAPDNPESGWMYYNTIEKKTYIFDGTSWQIIARDGKDGSVGSDEKALSLVWKGELSTAPENPEAGYYS